MRESATLMNARLSLLPLLAVVFLACATERPVPAAPRVAGPTKATGPTQPELASPPGIKLPDTFRPTAQRLDLDVVPSAEKLTGRTEIDGTLSVATDVVWLNADQLELTSAVARISGQEIKAEPELRKDERVALRFPRALPAGPVTLALGFQATISGTEDTGVFHQKSGGDWYAFTQFEETFARRAFPCVDEPSAKIPWTVTLHVPANVMAVSNTPATGQAPESNAMKAVRFAPTRPLPAYLVAFGVGPFDVLEGRPAGKKHVPVRVITPRGRASEGAWAARVSPEILEALEDYFGMAYPYEKLDVLSIPVTVQFGAMENVGLVTFSEKYALAKPAQDTVDRRRKYALVAAHEFAHQWFGDLVTTAWWNDIWLNEAFATWMQTKAIEKWAPSWGMRAERVDERSKAANADILLSARIIRQPVETYDDIRNAFDSITYEKGASVLRMFEQWVGEEPFRRGVQRYLESHADGNATADDFLRSISESAGRDVAPAFNTFLDRPGVPRIRASLRCGGKGPGVLHLAQDRWLPAGSKGSRASTWQIPVCVRWSAKGTQRSTCTLLDAPTADVKLEGSACPEWILPNAGYAGYYRLQLEGDLKSRLVRSGKLEDAEVVGLLGDTSALVRGGAEARSDGLALAGRYARTRDHHVMEAAVELADVREDFLAGRLGTAYAAWVRKAFGPRAEALGFAGKAAEDDETKLLRPALVAFVAKRGQDPKLVAEARQISERWLSRSDSVDPETLDEVMRVAGRFGSADFHQALLEKLDRTSERRSRDWLLHGISATRDGKLLDENVALAASGKLNPREMMRVLTGDFYRHLDVPLEFEATRARILEDVDASWVPLTAHLTRGGLGRIFHIASVACSKEERARAEQVFGPRAPQILGGPRNLAQALEQIDLCVVEREHEIPSLEKFFAGPAPSSVGAGR